MAGPPVPRPPGSRGDSAAQGRCATCRHWSKGEDRYDSILNPTDPDTYEPMKLPFEVRLCTHPKLLFCERPIERDGFAVADGSEYMANLYTAEDFGCVRWEARDASE